MVLNIKSKARKHAYSQPWTWRISSWTLCRLDFADGHKVHNWFAPKITVHKSLITFTSGITFYTAYFLIDLVLLLSVSSDKREVSAKSFLILPLNEPAIQKHKPFHEISRMCPKALEGFNNLGIVCCTKYPVTNNSCLHKQDLQSEFLWTFHVVVFLYGDAQRYLFDEWKKDKKQIGFVVPFKSPLWNLLIQARIRLSHATHR